MSYLWLVIGFAGEGCMALRFLVQWIASERRKTSYVPVSFWFISIAGGALLFAYGVYREDPVWIVGQTTGIIVYVRNLILLSRRAQAEALAAAKALSDPAPPK
ncbi:MAG: hypothetical protein FJ279_01940 [Planctomycetes bacterium]|nr:hypothetical protein [Planctomycetota bacterium]MBM4083522.1 hypothetical protein [Planctomycetota bacterium]